jgi:hypothetical protein
MSEYTHCIQCNCYFCCFIFYFPLRGYLFEFFVPIFSRLYLLLFSFDSQCQKRFFFFFRSLLIVPYEKGSSPCMRSFTIFCRNFKNEKGMSVALQSSGSQPFSLIPCHGIGILGDLYGPNPFPSLPKPLNYYYYYYYYFLFLQWIVSLLKGQSNHMQVL